MGWPPWIAERVRVQGRPQKHPSEESVRQLLEKMDDDEDWPPGKVRFSFDGRPSQVPEINESAMARGAMALKSRGVEPLIL